MTLNTLNQKRLPESSGSILIPLGEWQVEMKLTTYERMLVDIYSTYPLSPIEDIKLYQTRKRSVMLEYLAEVKKLILTIRSRYLNRNTQNTKSFLTLDQDSISKGKDYYKSWIGRTKENSKKLWLPTKTDCVVSDLNLSSISSKVKAMLKSWFSVTVGLPQNANFQPTYFPSSLSLVPECTVLESTKSKSRKTKIYFNRLFRPKMKQMIGTYRYFYNQGVAYLNSLDRGFYKPKSASKKKPTFIKYEGQYLPVETDGEYCYGVIPKYDADGKQIAQTSFQSIRNHLKKNQPGWFEKLPVHIIDQASRECASNFLSIINKRKADKKKFSMQFKSKRKSVDETVTMESSSLRRGKIYPGVFREYDSYVYCKEPMNINNNKKEYKIIYDRNTHGYFISLIVQKKFSNVQTNNKWCSIDPGEKTFATIYNPYDREVLFVGNNERHNFYNSTIDKLQRSISIQKTRCKIKALQRARNRNKYKQLDMHHKIANYLCSNFKHIIVPDYGIKSMKINSTVNRSMRNLGFYQFLTFLKHKCSERNVKLYIVNESYTTQACCNCGSLNKPNDRSYVCSQCNLEIHRDANGAVNIGLKHVQ